MIRIVIKTDSIQDLETNIEDLYSKQTVRLLKYEKGEYFTNVIYSGLNEATIKACVKIYEPNLQNELIRILKTTNESGMTLEILREELTKIIEEL